MKIEIKKSIKPVNYLEAISLMEDRLEDLVQNRKKELIWTLEHDKIYTAGVSFKDDEVIDKSIKIIKTNRGGKITCHGPGQLICYFVIDLRKKKNIRYLVSAIENTIIQTLKTFGIDSFSDKENIGIWYNEENKIKKVAAIGIKVKKWIAYHGFSININNDLNQYKKIVPCGIFDKDVTNLKKIKNQDYSQLEKKLINNFINNLRI